MIENLINQTIEAAKKERTARVKEASDKQGAEEQKKSPIAYSLCELAALVRKEASFDTPVSEEPSTTKVAEESTDIALKGLTLLTRYAEGSYAR